ncbi:MAG: hypothetical protein JWM32_2312 [Verrucomicrobia bacterium]|nr:hypothetical protein [Verrucomicrobiota bacterium]
MKSGRVLLVFGVVVVALLLLAAVAVFNPSVQTWAAQKALANQSSAEISVGHVSAGLRRVDLQQVRIVRAGAVLTLPSAEIELPVYSAAVSNRIFVRRLVAHGWTLDLTRAQSTPPPVPSKTVRAPGFSLISTAYAEAPPPPALTGPMAPVLFTGIFDYLKLPVDLSLDGVDLAGEIILAAMPNRPAARVIVTITGGGLAAGRPGKFEYTAHVTFAGDALAVRELTIRGTLGAVMDTPRTISRLVATTEGEAAGPQFAAPVKLSLDLSAARSSYGENYAVSISSGAKQLAAVETSYPAGATHLAGNWRLDMRDTDVAPFSFGHSLPTFEGAGEGRFDVDTAFAELHASGRLNTTVDHIGVIDAQLVGLGAVHLTADFDFAQRAAGTRVDRLDVTIEGAKPVAAVRALQAFEFNLKTGELNVADPSKELLGVVLQGLPIAWINPLLENSGLAAKGGDIQGEFAASARNGGFAIRSKAPLAVTNLSLGTTAGKAYISALDISVTASADYTPQGWQVELAPFAARSNGISVLTIDGRIGQLAGDHMPIKAAGKWSGQLPGLLAQPAVMGSTILSGGDLQGEFAANLGDKHEVQLKFVLTKLAAPHAPDLPSISADLRLDREHDGKMTFSLPIRFEKSDRKSDLNLVGTASFNATGVVLDARVTSDFLAIEDAQILAAPFSGGPAGSAAASPSPGVAAVQPFWAGLSGQVALSLKKVVYNGQFQVTDLTGSLRIEAGALKLVDARGGFDANSDVKLSGGVTFAPARPEPYALSANFALNNFDTAAAFRAIDPTKPPTVEARINLTSQVNGSGLTLAEMAEHAHGDLLVTSKGGIFRGLSADLTDRIQKAQSRLTAVASFLGVVADDYVNKAKILSDIAKSLSEIPFDQLSVSAARDASLNLQIKELSLISPEVRVSGEGTVRNVEGVPVLAQPLELTLKMGARGKLGDLIKRAGLLESRQDNLGYAAFSVPLRIGGTLANPDTNDIRTALLNSALERSGLLDSLLGK